MFVLLAAAFVFSACSQQEIEKPQANIPDADVLTVTFGETERTYTRTDLEALGAVEVDNGEGVYVGVLLKSLLEDAGVAVNTITTVKAVAIDGFSSTYDSSVFLADDTLVAYAKADGPLAANEGNSRMVVPGQSGSMNARLLITLQVIQ
jgi:hypothetical protein